MFQASSHELALFIFCLFDRTDDSENIPSPPFCGFSSKLKLDGFSTVSYKKYGRSEFKSTYSLFLIAFNAFSEMGGRTAPDLEEVLQLP